MPKVIRFGSNEIQALNEACMLLDMAQRYETVKTGITFNTHGLTPTILAHVLEANSGSLYLAFEGETAVGTLALLDDYRKSWYRKQEDVHPRVIKYVGVDPAYQGRGIASMLICEAVNDCEELLSVSTDELNKHAIHLYERNGFQRVELMRSRGARSNAVRLALWKDGCPWSKARIRTELALCNARCLVKSLLYK